MSKIFIFILYVYVALQIFAFGGRTAEITYDASGNVIQQVYDRKGNMIGVYDEKGVQLKDTEYNSDGYITNEKIYENGRLVKETEYEPYIKNDDSTFTPERIEMFEYNYSSGSNEAEVVLTVIDGDITATDSVVHQMQSADNYVTRGAFGIDGSGDIGRMTVYIYSITEFGEDYDIKVKYNSVGDITKVQDSRDKDKEKEEN